MKKEELKELIREIIKEELYKKNTENEKEILIKKKKQKPINKEIIYYVTELGDNPNKRELGIYFGENNLLKAEETALLIYYGYNKFKDISEILDWKEIFKQRIRTNR